jgi:hypothetical protein
MMLILLVLVDEQKSSILIMVFVQNRYVAVSSDGLMKQSKKDANLK